MRAVTDGPLADSNRRMLDVLMEHPALIDEIPALTALRQHLVFWLNNSETDHVLTPIQLFCRNCQPISARSLSLVLDDQVATCRRQTPKWHILDCQYWALSKSATPRASRA